MNIAPPPEMRRTTSKPYFSAFSGSTSFLTDWKLPITTAGSSHSQMRSVGLRRALADLLGEHLVERQMHERAYERPGMHELPLVVAPAGGLCSARRIAVATDSGVNPSSSAPSGRAACTAAAIASRVGLGGQPVDRRVDRRRGPRRVRGRSRRRAGSSRSAVHHIQVDDDELAAGNLELAVHGTSLVSRVASLTLGHLLPMPA